MSSFVERPALIIGIALSTLCLLLGNALLSDRASWTPPTLKQFLRRNAGASTSLEEEEEGRPRGVIPSRASRKPRKKKGTVCCFKNSTNVNAADYIMTKSKMQALATNNYIMVTFANYNFLDFAENWVSHIQGLGITAYVVMAMDDAILKALVPQGINAFTTGTHLNKGNVGWFTPGFHELQVGKTDLLMELSKLGLDIILSDVDTVWLRNPIDYCERYRRADILAGANQLWNSTNDGGLEDWTRSGSTMLNIGILLLRGRKIVAEFLKEYHQRVVKNESSWDQQVFNDLLNNGLDDSKKDPDRLVAAYNGQLQLGVFPIALFTSGHPFFIQRLHERLGLQPYVAHAIYTLGKFAKRHRLRNRLLWHDKPSYFNPSNGFVSFDFDMPEEMLRNAKPVDDRIDISLLAGHFDLVHHQLLQLRNAFAIAQTLNRTLIIPQTWCGVDQSWGLPHSGCWPGTQFELPFPCPLDHLLLLDPIVGGFDEAGVLDEAEFGPPVDIREASFLYNPRLPAAVNASRLLVEVSDSGCDGVTTLGPTMRPHLDDQQVKALFTNATTYKIIHFSSMLGAFGNFSDAADSGKFERRMKRSTGFFCCTEVDGVTGKVNYDAWFDRMPHLDKSGRVWNATWKPMLIPN
ncbi:hypothetical protein BSKO_12174 [Bryopsis sp. KO-2023]|nr:hypothetical protein BSKO_12174 [Bryopsis sp. KO-2023]